MNSSILHSIQNLRGMKMIKTVFGLIFLLNSVSGFGQLGDDFKMPETWEKDFVITLSYHSSMSGGKTEIKFTFDSCTYMNQSHHSKKPKHGSYKMKETDRIAILKKLKELKADRIKSERSIHAVYDGWSQSICFGLYCIEGGTSTEMSNEDKNQFLTAFGYLEEFAAKKAR